MTLIITEAMGRKVREIRKYKQHKTQFQFAEELGISRGYVAQIEQGDLRIGEHLYWFLEKALGTSLKEETPKPVVKKTNYSQEWPLWL